MKKQRKKIGIDRNKRILLLAGLLVCIVIFTALLVSGVKEKRWETREESLLSYGFKNQAEYQVRLKPNPYVKKQIQDMGKAYIQKLVDLVQVQLFTSYEGDKIAQLSGNYQVKVFLRGYQMNEGEKDVIWERNIKELEHKKIKEKSAVFREKTEVTIVPSDYDKYGELALQDLNVSTSKEIVVEARGMLRVKKKGKTIKLPIETSVCIPMEQERYEIACTEKVEKVDSIVEKKQEQLGMDAGKVGTCVAVLCLCIIAVIVLLWKTKGDTKEIRKKKRKEKELQAQVRKTISLSVFPGEMETAYKVKDIEGIFWLAEELRRPVFSQKVEEGIYFLVFDETKMYTFFQSCI